MENFTPEKTQKELSPETVEKTMEKVFDIDTKCTAYSSAGGFKRPHHNSAFGLSWNKIETEIYDEYHTGKLTKDEFEEKLKQKTIEHEKELIDNVVETEWKKLTSNISTILHNGLIGVSKEDFYGGVRKKGPIKEKYLERVQKKQTSDLLVYANIVGRSENPDELSNEIGNSYWIRDTDFNVSIIFDKNFFEEVSPKDRDSWRTLRGDKWKFNADDPGVKSYFEKAQGKKPTIKIGDEMLQNYGFDNYGHKGFDEKGMPRPDTEYGFVFFPRVPKRTFKGLVVKIPKDELYDQRIQEVADVVMESNLQIPIYDTDGNVVWPKKMSFEDIKKLDNEKKQKTEI
jgi:hypothetical protein